MYAAYWGLTESPFQNTLDLRWFYESSAHDEALSRLFFLVEQERRCGLLSGPAGTGKSLLLEMLFRETNRTQRAAARIDLVGRTSDEVVWDMSAALGLAPRRQSTSRELWQGLQDRLQAHRFSRTPTVVLFDHVDRATSDGVAAVQRLLHIGSSTSSGITFVLTTRDESVSRLPEALAAASDLHIELAALDRAQTREYVETLLGEAGASRTIFDPSAINQLQEITHGIPRDINRLCDLSLLAAMTDDLTRVTGAVVLAAAQELKLAQRTEPRVSWTSRLSPTDFDLSELTLQST